MYAIIRDSGRQYRVEEGQEIQVDFRDIASGEELTFDNVLAYSDGSTYKIGSKALEGAKVTGEVVGLAQGPKLTVQKFRRRKTYRRRTGHRQLFTTIKINKITV